MVVFHNFTDEITPPKTLSLPTLKKNSINIQFVKSDVCETIYDGKEPILPFTVSAVFPAKICDWRRLSAVDDACKAVYEVTFDITDSSFDFKPGDTIGIIPHNPAAEVDAIIDHLELSTEADLQYSLEGKFPAHIPKKCTLRHVLTHCVDIRSILKKLFILALSKHTKDDKERRVLEYFCSKEGSSTYTSCILNRNFCILDIFTNFNSCKPPIEDILCHLPRLLPRPYSIVNSKLMDANVLKICFSVMNMVNRKGLATSWLEDLILNEQTSLEQRLSNLSIVNMYENNKIPIYLRKNMSGFGMPTNWNKALILIGPGTGVAPYIGFLEEKQIYKKENPNIELGEAWLFFGCRMPKLDFIYEKELDGFLQNGVLNKLSTAFSRIENNGIKYVQDALIQNGEQVVKLIEKGAVIFLCGDKKQMAAQVKESLQTCLMTHRSMSLEDAEKYICDMQKDKTYVVDIWS